MLSIMNFGQVFNPIIKNKLPMKKTASILNICIMASKTSFAQTELKNGVYEFSFSAPKPRDTTNVFRAFMDADKIINHSRTLIVKNDTALYSIENIEFRTIATTGTRDNYF
jgi:hypothetical protein